MWQLAKAIQCLDHSPDLLVSFGINYGTKTHEAFQFTGGLQMFKLHCKVMKNFLMFLRRLSRVNCYAQMFSGNYKQ